MEIRKKEIEKSQARYKELFEQFKRYFDLVQVMIVTLDEEGNVITANRKAAEVLSYERSELIGMNWFDHFVPNGIKPDLNQHFERIKVMNNGTIDYHENPIRSKDGTEKIIAWHNTLIKDDAGNVVDILSAGLDITELRRTQDKLFYQLNLSKDLYSIVEKLALEKLNVLSKICVELFGVSLVWVGYAAPDKSIKTVGSYPETEKREST